jgi:transcriptional regulator with XRE-family HTH domain
LDFAAKVYERLDELGRTQTEFAREIGLSPQRLNNYLKARRPPDVESLIKIAQGLGLSTDYLLGIGPPKADQTRSVILALLELEGFPQKRSVELADLVEKALQVVSHAPHNASPAELAVHYVWQEASKRH